MLKLLNVLGVASYYTAQSLFTEINRHVMINCNIIKEFVLTSASLDRIVAAQALILIASDAEKVMRAFRWHFGRQVVC